MILGLGILIGLAIFYGWRYSKTDLDPDQAMFMFEGFGVGIYGRDYADCKTPVVHAYFWMLAKIAGRDVGRVKFLHHLLVGLGAALVYGVTGNFWGSLALAVMVNSGWLLAFHGNVGQWPAILIALSLTSQSPILAGIAWAAAVAWEPKLILAWLVWAVLGGQLIVTALIVSLVIFTFVLLPRAWKAWLIEANLTIPGRMNKGRAYPWMPWFSSQGAVYFLPWLALAVMGRPDWAYWLPAMAFALITGMGKVVRQNHLLPLVGWIAMAVGWSVTAGASTSPSLAAQGPLSGLVLVLILVDWVSAGGYLGDIWSRFYHGLAEVNNEARRAGEWLKHKSGVVWVNGLHSAVYVYAQAKVPYKMAEQIEIREVATERRSEMLKQFEAYPPDWMALTMAPGVTLYKDFQRDYHLAAVAGGTQIWRRSGRSNN